MKLPEKILALRKTRGMSQEDLAEKLNISRQTVSRWESGSAMPDANNILQLSRLFDVTTDYLLYDEYEEHSAPKKTNNLRHASEEQILVFMVTLEVIALLIQFVSTVILQNMFFAFLSLIPFIAIIGGFEYGYQKRKSDAAESTKAFRRKFYRITAWLGLYFPIRFLIRAAASLYPRPYSSLILEGLIIVAYIGAVFAVGRFPDETD